MADFPMPSLGADMQEGTLVEWLVKPGDRVKRRDVVAVVETDKAAIEIEVYEDGVIERLVVEPGQKVPVGTVLAVIRTDGEPAAAPKEEVPPVPAVPPDKSPDWVVEEDPNARLVEEKPPVEPKVPVPLDVPKLLPEIPPVLPKLCPVPPNWREDRTTCCCSLRPEIPPPSPNTWFRISPISPASPFCTK